jgi:type I restriction enzyme S subunit
VSWRRVALKEIGKIVGGGTPSTKDPANFGDEFPWITPRDLSRQAQRFVVAGERGISQVGLSGSTAKLLPAGTVLVSSRAPIGLTAIAKVPVTTNQGCRSFIPGDDADSLFMYYRLASMTEEFEKRANGSTFKEISGSSLAEIEIDLPSLAEQRAIAATLGALDDKIESNRRAAGLVSDLVAAKFRSAISESEPSFVPLGELTQVVNGRSYKSSELAKSTTALVTLKSIDRNGGYKDNGLKPYTGDYKPEQVVHAGEIVVAQTDLTQGAEVVGRGVRVPASGEFEILVASLDLAIVRPVDDTPVEYLLGLLTSEDFRQWCRSRVTGTTVLHLSKDAIPTWPAPMISLERQRKYAESAGALYGRLDSLEEESRRLATLRDTILPELLSGRIRSVDIEDQLA